MQLIFPKFDCGECVTSRRLWEQGGQVSGSLAASLPELVYHLGRGLHPIGESRTMCMEATDLYTARVQIVEAMEQGLSWHEAAKRAGLQISQSTAYRLRQRMLYKLSLRYWDEYIAILATGGEVQPIWLL